MSRRCEAGEASKSGTTQILLYLGAILWDFALDLERGQGLSPGESIRRGARLRVRPIIMTTLAAIMTAVPLAIGTGPGFELRQPLGIAVGGGLLVSQVLTPLHDTGGYLTIDRLRRRRQLPSELGMA